MALDYRASNIAEAERKYNRSFFDALAELGNKPSVNGMAFLFEAGKGSLEEFDELFKSGVDKVMTVIMEGLAESGFLTKTAVEETKRVLAQTNQRTSENTGEEAKA